MRSLQHVQYTPWLPPLNGESFEALTRPACLQDFQFVELIGKGSFGKVAKVISKKSKQAYALKRVDKAGIERNKLKEQLLSEILLLNSLNHENVVKLFTYFEDSKEVYQVLELSSEGTLYEKMVDTSNKGMDEQEASKVESFY